MSCETLEEKLQLEHLRAEYNGAFAEWAFAVKSLLVLEASADEMLAVNAARERVAAAEDAYRLSRDRLAQGLQRNVMECKGDEEDRSPAPHNNLISWYD